MTLIHIIKETALMMGFTFIIGIAFAYVLKTMTFFFSTLNGEDLPILLKKSRIWGRAYRMDIAHIYRDARYMAWADDDRIKNKPLIYTTKAEVTQAIEGLSEYHCGNAEKSSKQDLEMTRLYEFHYGKI